MLRCSQKQKSDRRANYGRSIEAVEVFHHMTKHVRKLHGENVKISDGGMSTKGWHTFKLCLSRTSILSFTHHTHGKGVCSRTSDVRFSNKTCVRALYVTN